jgi:hypothetical protein
VAPTVANLDEAIQAIEEATGPRRRDRTADLESLEDGVDLAVRAERATAGCPGEDALDRAIPLIAREHGLTEVP